MGADKRQFKRVPIVTQIDAQAGGFPFIAVAENISAGGMLIHTAKQIQEGQVVHLKFTLPGGEDAILVDGIVQHTTPGSYLGIQFQNLDDADRAAIEKLAESA